MNKIDLKDYRKIEKEYGYVASWAIWEKAGVKPKSNIGNIDILNPEINKNLLSQLNPNVIMVGLNFSRDVKFEKPFMNFHSSRSTANDFKIRYAFEGTPFWGAYMTDILKNLPTKSSKEAKSYLKKNPDLIIKNIVSFKEELAFIKSIKPVIIAFGNDCYELLKNNLEKEFYSHLIRITHYSHQISKEKYKEQVLKQINDAM